LFLASLSFSQKFDTLLTIPLHQQVCINNNILCIKYESMNNDGRCPYGVFCKTKWAGQVFITLKINGDTITLTSYGGATNNKTSKNGYTMQVYQVYPYPGCTPDSASASDPRCASFDSSVVIAATKSNTGVMRNNVCSIKQSPLPDRKKVVNPLGRVAPNETKFLKRSKLSLFKSLKHQ
jgi:hypothetical protein